MLFAAAAAKSLQLCPTVGPHRQQPTRLPHPWDSPGKNTGVGCCFLLQHHNLKASIPQCIWGILNGMCLSIANIIHSSVNRCFGCFHALAIVNSASMHIRVDVSFLNYTFVLACLGAGLLKLMLLNCSVGEDSWESLVLWGDPTSPFWRRSTLGFLWKEWC